jgi:hypothetical protein
MKRRNLRIAICGLLALAALLSIFASAAVFAKSANPSIKASGGSVKVSSTKATAPAGVEHTVNVKTLPVETSKTAVNHSASLFFSGSKYAAAKKAAATNKNAPSGKGATVDSTTKSSTFGFNGMADSATICPYFGGCQPPDMALATSPSFVLQGVNTSFAIWDTAGHLLVGPINSQNWFGVPNPLPAGCDPAGPFLSDPRAFYDPNTGLFWTATLQVESAAFGVGGACNQLSLYWISNLNVNTGIMHVYAFDMTLGGLLNDGADYTQFGFSGSTVAFTGNMFNFTSGSFDFAEVQVANKHAMEQGLPVTPAAFFNLIACNLVCVSVDTVQPVETETTLANDPGVQYFVNSFNIFGDPNGNDCFFSACSGSLVWAFDPSNSTLGGSFVSAIGNGPSYVTPPNADEPGCFQCIETIDTRITGTPVYSVGGGEPLISFSLDTAVVNGGSAGFPSVVPGVLWGQIQVSHFSSIVVSANLAQSGYVFFTGDRAASFGAMMQDKNGRLFMVFDTSSANLNPSIMLVSRNASDPLGTIGNTKFLLKGPSATFDSRWGDFEATSYSGGFSNHVWVASQYSISGDWATFIVRVS